MKRILLVTIANWGGPAIERLNRLHDQFEPVGISYDGNSGGLRMLQTRDGRIWIGSWEDGLLLCPLYRHKRWRLGRNDGRSELLQPTESVLRKRISNASSSLSSRPRETSQAQASDSTS